MPRSNSHTTSLPCHAHGHAAITSRASLQRNPPQPHSTSSHPTTPPPSCSPLPPHTPTLETTHINPPLANRPHLPSASLSRNTIMAETQCPRDPHGQGLPPHHSHLAPPLLHLHYYHRHPSQYSHYRYLHPLYSHSQHQTEFHLKEMQQTSLRQKPMQVHRPS